MWSPIFEGILQMAEVQKQKDHTQEQIEQLLRCEPPPQIVSSEVSPYAKEYQQFFQDVEEILPVEKLTELLEKEDIRYFPERNHTRFNLYAKLASFSLDPTTLELQLGPFSFQITLLHNLNNNYTHLLNGKASTFATIYEYNASNPESIIKCTSFKPKDFLDKLVIIIKEYSLLKIAGALGVGPKPTNIMGFDLVAFKDCIQFSMEKCLPLTKFNQSSIKILKQKLARLHQIQIIHADIKPENFCLSPTLNEPIFIDFGLSEVISQKVGQLTHTFFMGSLSYCSKQMSKLYYDSDSGFVDLYYNDTVCMSRSFAEMKKELKGKLEIGILESSFNHPDDESSQEQIDAETTGAWMARIGNYFALMKIKQLIFTFSPINNWFHLYEKLVISNKDAILAFINGLEFTAYIDQLIEKILSKGALDRQQLHHFKQNAKRNNLIKDEKKKQQIEDEDSDEDDQSFKATKTNEDPENEGRILLESRMKELRYGFQITRFCTTKKQLMLELNDKKNLLSVKATNSMQKSLYFKKFAKFTDLRNGFAAELPEPPTIIILMLEYINTEYKSLSLIEQLCICWDHILNFFLVTETQDRYKIIPVLFHNLMIAEYYSFDQLIEKIQKIGKIQLKSPMQKLEMLYMCQTATIWKLNRYVGRYDSNIFCDAVGKIFDYEIGKLSQFINQQIIYFPRSLNVLSLFGVGNLKLIFNLLRFLSQIKNQISIQLFYDFKINLITLFLRSGPTIDSIFLVKRLLSEVMLSVKYLKDRFKFNYYYFRWYKCMVYVESRECSLIQQGLLKCFQRVNLHNSFALHDYNIFLRDRNAETLIIQWLADLKPEKIGYSYNTIYQLKIYVQNKNEQTQKMDIFRKKINYQFMMQINLNLQGGDQLKNAFSSFTQLSVIFFHLYRDDCKFPESGMQMGQIYVKMISHYERVKDMDHRLKNSLETCLYIIIKLCYVKDRNYSELVEFQCNRLSLKQAQGQFDIQFVQNFKSAIFAAAVYRSPKVKQNQQYLLFLYNIWKRNRRLLILDNYYKQISLNQIFTDFLITRKKVNQILTAHFAMFQTFQEQFKTQKTTRYIHQIQAIIKQNPDIARKIISCMKGMSQRVFARLKKYYGSSVLLFCLPAEFNFNQASIRILKLCLQNISFYRGEGRIQLLSILYRYLIMRGFRLSTQNLASEKLRLLYFESHEKFLQTLKKEKDRKKAFWLRKLNKYTRKINNKFFPRSLLIKNYRIDNPFHKRLKKALNRGTKIMQNPKAVTNSKPQD